MAAANPSRVHPAVYTKPFTFTATVQNFTEKHWHYCTIRFKPLTFLLEGNNKSHSDTTWPFHTIIYSPGVCHVFMQGNLL